jgi:predicted transcriptional regulator
MQKKAYPITKKKVKVLVYDYLKKKGAQWLSTIQDDLNIDLETLIEAIMDLEKEHKIKEASEDQIGKRV